jgi:hypothetical protein
MSGATVAKLEDAPVYARGDGVETTLLIGREISATAALTSGLTRFPPGKKVPFHFHNCDGPLEILWIYTTQNVTRTFTETGQTVDHLSEKDRV